ncbi:hypothetical protein DFQ28_007340 [Apophysomyces sp. BC1034]|nr:hypothetical protein DFQ28_007340 [Apophysomyces sp. BC1034]
MLDNISFYYNNENTDVSDPIPPIPNEPDWLSQGDQMVDCIHTLPPSDSHFLKQDQLLGERKDSPRDTKMTSSFIPSAAFTSLREKFETETQQTSQPIIQQFDPLMTMNDEQQDTQKMTSKSHTQSLQDTLKIGHSVGRDTRVSNVSTDQLMISDTVPKRRQPVVLDVEFSTDKLNPTKSALATSSLKNPTRLPTPRTKLNRSSLPATTRRQEKQHMRALSNDTNNSLKWVESNFSTNLPATISTFPVATPKIDQPRLTTSTVPSIKSGNPAKCNSPFYTHKLKQTSEQKADVRGTDMQDEAPSSPRSRLVWLSMQRAQSIHVTREQPPDDIPKRSRKTSTMSTLSCGKANHALADFDPLLTDDSDDLEMPAKVNIKRSSLIRPKVLRETAHPPKDPTCRHNDVSETSQRSEKEGVKAPMTSLAVPFAINLTLPECDSKSTSKLPPRRSPTRIPLPVSKPPRLQKKESSSSEDESISLGDNNNSLNSDAKAKRNPIAKVGPTTTVYSGTTVVSNSPKLARTDAKAARKPASSSALKVPSNWNKNGITLDKNGASRNRKTSTVITYANKIKPAGNARRPSFANANELLQDQLEKEKAKSRRLSVNLVSAQGVISLPESIKQTSDGSKITSEVAKTISSSRRKMSTFHERLQEMVVDDAWSIHAERDAGRSQKNKQDEDVFENISTSTTASTREEIVNLYSKQETEQSRAKSQEQSKLIKEKEKGLRVAMSPQTALKLYKASLSPYERTEILEHSQIYFVGAHAKKRHASSDHTTSNFGYDDEQGDYHIVLRDHLMYRYEALEVMGKGSFGQVIKCFDHKSGQTLAIKIIRNKKRFHAQAMVEVKILEDLMRWDPEDKHNNVRMTDHFYFRSHLCIAFECLSINLYDFIKSNNFQGFSMGLIRRFTIQLLNSLMLLSKHKLIHCDLKPENILLKHPTKSSIKVIDFGSSCLESEKVYTYIQSRFYRSPEIILGLSYSMAIDMWSVGCILAELFTGHPLFPGENEQDQLACIMEIQGVPEKHLIDGSTRRKMFFDTYGNPRIMPNSKGRKRKPGTKKLAQALKCTDEYFADFIDQCLQWDPERRLSPTTAFKHPWIRCKKSN